MFCSYLSFRRLFFTLSIYGNSSTFSISKYSSNIYDLSHYYSLQYLQFQIQVIYHILKNNEY